VVPGVEQGRYQRPADETGRTRHQCLHGSLVPEAIAALTAP
jgi:hypothetical protein